MAAAFLDNCYLVKQTVECEKLPSAVHDAFASGEWVPFLKIRGPGAAWTLGIRLAQVAQCDFLVS